MKAEERTHPQPARACRCARERSSIVRDHNCSRSEEVAVLLCTVIWDAYRDSERRELWRAIQQLLPVDSPNWSRQGVYAYWDPDDTRELLYVGLASSLPERFAQHNRLIPHSGGNKADKVDEWFRAHDRLGFTLLVQSAAVQTLDDLYAISPLLGVEKGEIPKIAEGQLIELHKMAAGKRPAWNRTGGSVLGAKWARPSGRSVIGLLSAADENLFVARRTLRELVIDDAALRHETTVHGARMAAIEEMHEVEDFDSLEPEEKVAQISRYLMLRNGKLVDDLAGADHLIRQWLVRMSDPEVMAARLEKPMADLAEMIQDARDPRDQMAAAYISMLMASGWDEQSARDAAAVLASGYLDGSPTLST